MPTTLARALIRTFACATTLLAACSDKSSRAPSDLAHVGKLEGYPLATLEAIKNRAKGTLVDSAAKVNPEVLFKIQSVIQKLDVWGSRNKITVAFLGGSAGTRARIADAVTAWSKAGNIAFDFWTDSTHHTFREWSRSDVDYQADIRIAFDSTGYWSLIGRDSRHADIARPGTASMNLEGFDQTLPDGWQAITLHEFGHAIGLAHELKNPFGACDSEFRWADDPGYVAKLSDGPSAHFIPDDAGRRPGIYTVLRGTPNRWRRSQVDDNIRQFAFDSNVVASEFDPKSIMMYYFEPWMFVTGVKSKCYSTPNNSLSPGDQLAVRNQYGASPTAPLPPDSTVSERLRVALKSRDVPAPLHAQLRASISRAVAEYDRQDSVRRIKVNAKPPR